MARKKRSLALVLQSPPESGGANHYELSLARLIEKVSHEIDFKVEIFVPGDYREDSHFHHIRTGYLDGLRLIIQQLFPFSTSANRKLKLGTAFSKQVADMGIGAVYFASPNKLAVDLTLPQVITTVWDIGHRDLPHLPEMASRGRWFLREIYFRFSLKNSKFVVTDSSFTTSKLQKIYGVLASKTFSIGLLPLNHEFPDGPKLIEEKYFIYPAQKWRHKNHTTILKAFRKVVAQNPSVKLVLTGSDKGEGKKILREISSLGLEKHVLDLGFVGKDDLVNLQFHAKALLMPSRLGPTNIPPLDAVNLGTHAIVSDAHKFEDEIQNILTVVPAKNTDLWAKAMLDALNKEDPARVKHSSVKAELTLVGMLESLSLDQ